MGEPAFDAGLFYEFDVSAGTVRSRGGNRVLVVSERVIRPLVEASLQKGDLTALRRLGKDIGEHVASFFDVPLADLSPEVVLGHAAGVLSLFGWGRLAFERWGSALVAVLEGAPALDEGRLGTAALLGGAVSALAGREVACVPVEGASFLVVDPSIAEQVWSWAKEGVTLAELVGRLVPREAA